MENPIDSHEKKSGVAIFSARKDPTTHEQRVHEHLAKKIADLLATEFCGDVSTENSKHLQKSIYFVPNDTLVTDIHSEHLGIYSANDFFGGMVSDPSMATKAITHPLFKAGDQAPEHWPKKFSQQVSGAVLKGYTVFNLNDVQRAGSQLLLSGPVRVKSVRACAGRGQHLVASSAELTALIATLDEDEIATWGIVIEENLSDVRTYSVGQVTIAGITTTYVGTQSLTRANDGEMVYGGSTLSLVRGNYADLLALPLPEKMRLAVSQARVYEEAAFAHIPGLIASRRNYDVAQGINAQGDFCSGVLEQSWRIGGASAAEIYALEAFARDASLTSVQAATRELYGAAELPAHTAVLYCGEDAEVGLITKLVTVEPYGNPDTTH